MASRETFRYGTGHGYIALIGTLHSHAKALTAAG